MTREIKFRAWASYLGEPFKMHHFDFPCLIGCGSEGESESEDYVITQWMQYTGLKDRNGVEIYEGDIVKGTNDNWDSETKTKDIETIKWDEITCGFLPFSSYDIVYGTQTYPNDVEVIGNVYQNPELLTGRITN